MCVTAESRAGGARSPGAGASEGGRCQAGRPQRC